MSETDPTRPGLSDFTVTELVTELKKRHDALVVFGEIDRTDEETSWCSYTKGRMSRIIGMAERGHKRLLKYAGEDERESKIKEDGE